MNRPVVLCGLGRVGWRVFDSIRAAGLPVVVVDTNVAPDDARLFGSQVVRGDFRRADVLEQAGMKEASGVVIVTSDDLVNISTAMLARKLNPTARIVVRMFNPNLIAGLGGAMKNTVALSVSALTAPVLAIHAVSGDALGAFKLENGPRQISELKVSEGSDLAGTRLIDASARRRLVPLVYTPKVGSPTFLQDIPSDTRLSPGDRLVVCGSPADLLPLVEEGRGILFPGVRWAGGLRRWFRTFRRTLREVDLSVKIATPVLFFTILASVLVFRYGLQAEWAEGLYQTVSVIATGAELHGEEKPGWAKVFLSLLKLSGAALIAAFTAILTQYLIRAKLGGALETRWVPDGGHVVVCGLGNLGYRLVNELTAMGERVVAIDRSAEGPFIATVRRSGVPTFVGDATVTDMLRQVNAGEAKAVIAATSSELANLEIALLVRGINPQQRVVVRLSDPEFAAAVREASDIRQAVSVPSLAAPAFVAALFGDRVLTLFTSAGHTLVVVEIVLDSDETYLVGKSFRALAIDYRMLPVAFAGHDLASVRGHRLAVGDRLTMVAELADLERLIRRQPVPATAVVMIDRYPLTAKESLQTLVQATRHCSSEEAEAIVNAEAFELVSGLTRGEAQELVELVARDRVTARVVIRESTGA